MSLCNNRRSIGLYVTIVLALVNMPVSGFATGRIKSSVLETTTPAGKSEANLNESATVLKNELRKQENNDTNTSKLTTKHDRVESSSISGVTVSYNETKTKMKLKKVNTASKHETHAVVMNTDGVINETTTKTLGEHITPTTPSTTFKENTTNDKNVTGPIIGRIISENISATTTNDKNVVSDITNTNSVTEMTNFTSYSAIPVYDTPATTIGKVAKVHNVTDVANSNTTATNLLIPTLGNTSNEATAHYVANNSQLTTPYSTKQLTENMVVESNSHSLSPSWKKYTTIQRNKVSTTKETPVTITEINTESYTNTENLRNLHESENSTTELPKLSTESNEESTLATEESNKVLFNVTNTDQNFTTSSVMEDASEGASGIVKSMSKIGGFLDLSTKTEKSNINTSQKPVKQITNTARFSEAHNQLAQDAIAEELLREQTLRDEKYREERLKIKNQPISNDTQGGLSVKPIVGDKINSSIYLVNPNYKPLKKIDVQPPKPFVRDPDDNSWRNESISSLGIVFKPKNSTKQFTQVLKNKTETELNGTLEKDNRNDVPDLRERLEKIAEIRKSKKKKINGSSEIVYTDYGESFNSGEREKKPYVYPMSIIPLPAITNRPLVTTKVNDKEQTKDGRTKNQNVGTRKPKKYFNILDYYESTDEDDKDYVTMTEIDLKRFTVPLQTTDTTAAITQTETVTPTTSLWQYQNEKRPTLQYFPPLKPQKVNINDYDTEFNKKVNLFTIKDDRKEYQTKSTPLLDDYKQERVEVPRPQVLPPVSVPRFNDVSKHMFFTRPPEVTKPNEGFSDIRQNENYNRDAYINVKHLKDFMTEAVFSPSTEAPMRGVTIADLAKETDKTKVNDYDYDAQFRKDVLNRFVDNFNQNSERFKVDFPILFNNSIVHKKSQPGKILATSNVFLKRLYDVATPKYPPFDPNCDNGDNVTVELSPAYELHYYVPEQEEKEPVQPKPPTNAYGYRY